MNGNLASRTLVFVFSLGLLVMTASAAVAQPPTGTDRPPTTPSRPTGAPPDGPPGQNASERPNATGRPSDMPEQARQPGRLTLANGSLDGRYVDLSYDEGLGELSAYTVGGTEFFSTISAPGAFEASARGAYASFEGDGFSIVVTDNPAGLLRIHSNGSAVELGLASGVEAVANGSRLKISAGNDSAMMTNGTLEGASIDALQAVFMLHGKSVAAVAQAGSPSQAQVEDAIARGHVAARVEVLENGTDVLDFQGADVAARRSANGSHRFIVDANFTTGRAFVVDFAPGLLRAEELGVLYYDEVNGTLEPALIHRADSLADVLLIEAGEGPEYWHVDELAGDEIVVAVPHFSVHAFDVYVVAGAAAPMIIVGVLAAAALVAVVAVSAVRGRRE